MSNDGKPPPVLDDDDLLGEIEQWGNTFDALHDEDPATSVRDSSGSTPVPVPDAALVAAAAPAATGDQRETDFSDLGIDGPPEALGSLLGTPPPLQDVDADSAARADAEPARRPSGRRVGTSPGVVEEEEVFTSASKVALPQGPTDDELFGDLLAEEPGPAPASAQRLPRAPGVAAPRAAGPAIVRRDELDKKKAREAGEHHGRTRVAGMDEIESLREAPGDFDDAPFGGGGESTRVASLSEIAEQSRRTKERSEPPPFRGEPPRAAGKPGGADSDFGRDEDSGVFAQPEATKIADLAVLERMAMENRAAKAADAAAAAEALLAEPPAVDLSIDDDFYADFEIGDQKVEAEDASATAARRATAHVVRRPAASVGSGAVGAEVDREGSDAVEVDTPPDVHGEIAERDGVPAAAPAEDDFSDIARAMSPARGSEPAVVVAPDPLEDDAPSVEEVLAALGDRGSGAVNAAPVEGIADDAVPVETPDSVSGALRSAAAYEGGFDSEEIELIAPSEIGEAAGAPEAPAAVADVAPELPPAVFGAVDPELDLDAIALPESVDPASGFDPTDEAARMILVYERELETVDDAALAAALRCEAARLYERLGDGDRARFHYEAALLNDPRSFTALRGLRRIARASGDLVETTRQLDAEIGISGALERRALALHRVDLLMATGEQDLARVAVGELLDEGIGPLAGGLAQGDVRALLAQLELTFLDGRVDELGDSLERLSSALGDADLRGTLSVALGHLRERPDGSGGDPARARAAFGQGTSGAALLGLRRMGDPGQAVEATAALAAMAAATAEAGGGDPAAAAGLYLRTAGLAAGAELPAVAQTSLEHARALAPSDPLVAEALYGAAMSGNGGGDLGARLFDARLFDARIDALGLLGEVAATPAERTWALAHQATLRFSRNADGDFDAAAAALARAATADPGHDHVTAAHETQLAIAGDWPAVATLALTRVAADPTAERDRVTAARALAASGTDGAIGQAIDLLTEGRALSPGSATLADVLADALAVAGRWDDRVSLWSALAAPVPGAPETEQIDPELSSVRAAAAAEESVAALAASEPPADAEVHRRTVTVALEAWNKVLDFDADSQRGHAAAIAMARRLDDRDILADALGRAQTARSGAAAVTLGLERARLALTGVSPDLSRADEILAELPGDDPRRLAAALVVAARAGRWSDAAVLLEERAAAAAENGAALEAVALRYRAAQILLDNRPLGGDLAQHDDLGRAAQLLGQVLEDRPQLSAAADALSAARRRLGDSGVVANPVAMRATAAELGSGADAFARLVREAEVLGGQGDAHGAIGLLTRALELRSADPLATSPLIRLARAAGEPGPVTRLALEELKAAEDAGDERAKADAYETLARVDAEMRSDVGSAVMSWESAIAADPERHYVLRQLARAYATTGRWAELYAIRGKQLAALPTSSAAADGGGASGSINYDDGADAVALGLDRAALAEKEGVDEDELRSVYQEIVARDPRQRIALFHLEALVRRAGSSLELADLERAISETYTEDSRSRAAFLTRSGETLADLEQLETAIERFRAAEELVPGYVPALQGWRNAALRGGLWLDVADAASREAPATSDDGRRAALYHLGGVALMDRALVGERAVPLFRKALAADPKHHDAFVRLRILLDEQGEQEELARLLEERLVHEDETPAKIALHRALAEVYRNFLGDRESSKYNLRAILELEPNDLRAVAVLSDICWEQGAWAEAAEALVTRARLERDPRVLRHLYYRLGTIYADRIPEPALALKAFQRVLAADPEDVDALERIADLGIATGEWKMALGACERLVKGEPDSERKVAHLHRVGRIFAEGFNDRGKAERAYRMALDATPTSDAALDRLVLFFQGKGDLRSVRMSLDRLATLMQKKLEQDPGDGVAARVIARAMAIRQGVGVVGSIEVARAAAELARALGTPFEELGPSMVVGDLRPLVRPEADDLLYPRSAPPELRQIFALLGERVAKHVGVDLRPYGVTRGDRLRARENPVATAAQEIADQLGLGEIDVYVSTRQPLAMQAEPTSPVSLVIGAELARPEALAAVRFAAGAALKLAQSHLAIVARMGEGELAALTVALLRLFNPEMPYLRVDEAQVSTQLQKLRRMIPSGLLTELRPYALGLDTTRFDHEAFQRGVVVGGLRAGVRAAGSLGVALQVLAAQRQIQDLATLVRDPTVRELITFAVGEDHARLVQLTG